jgi:hypothetical protein
MPQSLIITSTTATALPQAEVMMYTSIKLVSTYFTGKHGMQALSMLPAKSVLNNKHIKHELDF